MIRVETWQPGVEWVSAEDSFDDALMDAAANAAMRSAAYARRAAHERLGRYYIE